MSERTLGRELIAAIERQLALNGAAYAFVAVTRPGGGWQIAVAIEHEPGFNPIDGGPGLHFALPGDAWEFADKLNDALGLTAVRADQITISTMRMGAL